MTISIIILAAGKGTRMKSSLPKVMHRIAGREMVNLVIDTASKLNPESISLVISKEMSEVEKKILATHQNLKINFAIQENQLGTGDAVKSALSHVKKISNTVFLVLYGDTPLLQVDTLEKMADKIQNQQNAICVLGFDCTSPNKYGKLIVEDGSLDKIVEFKDANNNEKNISLCNSGVIAISGQEIKNLIGLIDNKNASGEYYLTDIVDIARKKNLKCSFIKADEKEVMGVNSRSELSQAEKIKQKEIKGRLMEGGVTMLNPESIYCSFDTKIANDVIIEPNVFFGCGVEVERNVQIKSFCHIEGTKINSESVIGPFARIRPDTIIEKGVKIGNFVEIKKSKVNKGAKISHLSYIGDCEIGEESNVGAGTITCNYDGYKKFNTTIGKNVFIGSNTSLIAPIKIANNAVIGAGSVISKDVEASDLAVSRSQQINIKSGGKNYHSKKSPYKKDD